MKQIRVFLGIAATAGSLLLAVNASAGRYDGISDVFNSAARNGGLSDTFNSASGAGRLADKGQLSWDFNKAAGRAEETFETPTPQPKPNFNHPPYAPGM